MEFSNDCNIPVSLAWSKCLVNIITNSKLVKFTELASVFLSLSQCVHLCAVYKAVVSASALLCFAQHYLKVVWRQLTHRALSDVPGPILSTLQCL
jgi:hypothetical protein